MGGREGRRKEWREAKEGERNGRKGRRMNGVYRRKESAEGWDGAMTKNKGEKDKRRGAEEECRGEKVNGKENGM